MGLFPFLSSKEDKLRKATNASSEKRIKELLDIKARGGNFNEAAFMRPHNFYECQGGLAISAKLIFPIVLKMLSGDDYDDEACRHLWDDFAENQKYCDELFLGNGEMRIYVIAQTWKQQSNSKTWKGIDTCLEACGVDINTYRNEGWWRVACFEHLAEQGHEDREDFQAAWRSMSVDDRLAVVNELDESQVAFFKLID